MKIQTCIDVFYALEMILKHYFSFIIPQSTFTVIRTIDTQLSKTWARREKERYIHIGMHRTQNSWSLSRAHTYIHSSFDTRTLHILDVVNFFKRLLLLLVFNYYENPNAIIWLRSLCHGLMFQSKSRHSKRLFFAFDFCALWFSENCFIFIFGLLEWISFFPFSISRSLPQRFVLHTVLWPVNTFRLAFLFPLHPLMLMLMLAGWLAGRCDRYY